MGGSGRAIWGSTGVVRRFLGGGRWYGGLQRQRDHKSARVHNVASGDQRGDVCDVFFGADRSDSPDDGCSDYELDSTVRSCLTMASRVAQG